MQPLILLLLIPAALLLGTAAHHLLPPYKLTREDLRRGLRKLLRRDLSRSAFGLPPMPRRLTVRAATFLALCAAAGASLACGVVYLVLPPSLSSSSSSSSALRPLTPTRTPAALLAGTALLPLVATSLAAAGVYLRLPRSPGRVHTALGAQGRYLTHAAVVRATLAATVLAGALVGVCVGVPRYAAFVILGVGGAVSATAVGVGIAAWRGRRADLGAKFEAAASYAAAVSYARKSRDLLRSDTSNPTDTTWTHFNTSSFTNLPSADSHESDLLGEGDYSHILPPRELTGDATLAVPATPARGWQPPVGSPSSWVTEREMATLPEWDFRASLGHRRTSSSFTARTLAALGLGDSSKGKSSRGSETAQSTTQNTFHTALTQPNSTNDPSASLSSVRTDTLAEPNTEHSVRPDGSVVGVLEASPFNPLPPHNFSSLTKLSVPRSAGASDGVSSSIADLGGTRTLTLVDHGAHVAVHDLSSTSNFANYTSFDNAPARAAMRSSRSVNVLPTIPGTPAPPSTPPAQPSPRMGSWWPSELGDMSDTEWVPVDAPPASESWRRADSVCGVLGVLGLVLCFALTAPLLALGVHTATLTTFAVALALPAPALAAATFFTRHIPTVTPVALPSAAGVASTAVHPEFDRDSGYRTVDFTRIDFGQPRWSVPYSGRFGSVGASSARLSGPRALRPVPAPTPTVLSDEPVNPATTALPMAPTAAKTRPSATPKSKPPSKPKTPGARKHSFRRRELLKPKPDLEEPAGAIPKIRGKLARLRGGVMSICAEKHARDESMSGDEAAFVSLEKAEIRSAVRLTSRCPSFVDLSGRERLMFSDPLQAAVVERLTRRRTLDASADANASYRVESYRDDSASPGRRGEIMRVLRAELDLGEPEPRISSSSFDPARASTPLGYRPKGSTTTHFELDLSVDWEEMGLPPNPPLPQSYCGVAFAPYSVSHAPSTKLDGEAMARASHEADTSIQQSAGWIQSLMEGWTPRRASVRSARSAVSRKSTRSTTLPSIDEHATAPAARPKSWSHGTAFTTTTDMQTPSSIRRMPPYAVARPVAHLPPLPLAAVDTVPPPLPLPEALTRPIASPVGTSPVPPWTPGVASHTAPRRRDPDRDTAGHAPPPTPQRAEITRPEPSTYTYSVQSTPRPAEVNKAFGAVATVARAESCTPDTTYSQTMSMSSTGLRGLALVERARVRNSLKDSVSMSLAQLPAEASADLTADVMQPSTDVASSRVGPDTDTTTDGSSRYADASAWTEGSSRFADAEESLAYESPEKHTSATFGRHLLRNMSQRERKPEPESEPESEGQPASAPASEADADSEAEPEAKPEEEHTSPVPPPPATEVADPVPSQAEIALPAPAAAAILPLPLPFAAATAAAAAAPNSGPRKPAYSPLRSGPAYDATLASLREYSFPTQSPSQDDLATKPVGRALTRTRGSGTSIMFDDSRSSAATANRTFGVSTSSASFSRLSAGPESALADRTNRARRSTEPFRILNTTLDTTTSKTSTASTASRPSAPPGGGKENDPLTAHWTAGVRLGRGRRARGSAGQGPRALAPRV